MDIVKIDGSENGGTERRLFVVDCPDGKNPRLKLLLQPPLPPAAHSALRAELSAAMAIPIEQVSIQNRAEPFCAGAECESEPLCSINEEA